MYNKSLYYYYYKSYHNIKNKKGKNSELENETWLSYNVPNRHFRIFFKHLIGLYKERKE